MHLYKELCLDFVMLTVLSCASILMWYVLYGFEVYLNGGTKKRSLFSYAMDDVKWALFPRTRPSTITLYPNMYDVFLTHVCIPWSLPVVYLLFTILCAVSDVRLV